MKISEFLGELKRCNQVLYFFGWANLWLFIGCFLLYFIDDTHITGINAWIKPMKFSLSVAVYAWTYAWLLHYLISSRNRNFITWIVIVSMFVENFIIVFQASRGETSHYNISTPQNAFLFSMMGMFIGINTLINFYTLVLFFIKSQVSITDHTLVAWRAGLLLFFIGGISGGLMIGNMGHTFGAVDGGVGLPFTNWSTQAGDMRTAHFFTLHGLQAIPLFAWLVASKKKQASFITFQFFIFYSSVCLGMHFLAWTKVPLISI